MGALYWKNVPNTSPPTITRFIDVRKGTALQLGCVLIYAGHNIYILNSSCHAILQCYIPAIIDLDAPTRLSSLITHLEFYGREKFQQCAMWMQDLIAMGQDHLFKEEASKILDHRVYVVTKNT